MRRTALVFAALSLVPSAVWAQEPAADIQPVVGGHRPRFRPSVPPDCPTPPIIPVDPKKIDPKDPGKKDPAKKDTPPDPKTEPPAPVAPEAGTLAANTFNANMFGDQFGGAGTARVPRAITVLLLRNGSSEYARYEGVIPAQRYVPAANLPGDFPAQVLVNGARLNVGRPVFRSADPIAPGPNITPVNRLLENAQVTSILQAAFPGTVARYAGGTASERLDDFSGGGIVLHEVMLSYRFGDAVVSLPLPSQGGTVGRTKLADENSSLPRDRIVFNTDFYSNVTFTPEGFHVTRFAPGFEKTFLDQRASVEFRFPFASSLDATQMNDGITGRATEFGNVFAALKGLLIQDNDLNLAAGVAMALPTAPRAVLRSTEGRELLVAENESYILTPFLTALFTPTERFFAQAWVQSSFDLTGSTVRSNFDGRGLRNIGRLQDQVLLNGDLQVGYWIIRDMASDGLRGLAPFIELHYNTTLTDVDRVRADDGSVVGGANNRYDEVNLTAGMTAVLANNMMVSAGLVVPLTGESNRFFDYQFGLRVNWFFGPTARSIEQGHLAALQMRSAQSAAPTEPGPMPEVMPPAVNPANPAAPPAGPAPVAPEAGTLAANTFNPNFFGDLIGVSANRATGSASPIASRMVRVPLLPRYAGLKTTDNDGPRPQDRVSFSYNHYADVNGAVNPPGSQSVYLNRQLLGLETVIGENASIGARIPFIQSGGAEGFSAREVGDVTVTSKYAIYNDPTTGNVFTLGLNVTLPTGGRGDNLSLLNDGTEAPRAVFLQPWVGAAWTADDLFVQGTSAVLMPTDTIYPAVFWNSLGAGYWVYRNASDAFVRGVAPVVEVHVNTPLTHRGDGAAIFLKDQVNLTTGLQMLFPRLAIGGAICVPLAGPRPYDYEAMFTLNYQF